MDLLIFRSHRLIALAYEKGGQDMQKNIIVSPLLITGISLSCITHCRKGFSTAISSVNKVGISSNYNGQSRGSTKDLTELIIIHFSSLSLDIGDIEFLSTQASDVGLFPTSDDAKIWLESDEKKEVT